MTIHQSLNSLVEALVDLVAEHNLSKDEPGEYPDEAAELQAREVWGRAQQAIDEWEIR